MSRRARRPIVRCRLRVSALVALLLLFLFEHNLLHHRLVEQVEHESARRQTEVVCFQNLHDLVENGRLREARRFLGFDTVEPSVCDRCLLIQCCTYAWRSFAAFLASTVLPRSVASFRIRAFTASPSVTATLTSALRFQLMLSALALHGVIYICQQG
jgi:hypothetical protein